MLCEAWEGTRRGGRDTPTHLSETGNQEPDFLAKMHFCVEFNAERPTSPRLRLMGETCMMTPNPPLQLFPHLQGRPLCWDCHHHECMVQAVLTRVLISMLG